MSARTEAQKDRNAVILCCAYAAACIAGGAVAGPSARQGDLGPTIAVLAGLIVLLRLTLVIYDEWCE